MTEETSSQLAPSAIRSDSESSSPARGVDSVSSPKGEAETKGVAKTRGPRVSLFRVFLPNNLEEEQKSAHAKGKTQPDIIFSFADLPELWKDLTARLLPGKQGTKESLMKDPSKVRFEACYGKTCGFFRRVIEEVQKQLDGERTSTRSFSDDHIFLAIMGIQHILQQSIRLLEELLDKPAGSSPNAVLEDLFGDLRLFNDFFCLLAKLKCNMVLKEKHLLALQDAIKLPFSFLQRSVQSRGQLLQESEVATTQRRLIATLLYHILQTIALVAVFGEPAGLGKQKYQDILDRFKTILALMSQSPVCERICSETYGFEKEWELHRHKLTALSFGQRRLSIYTQKDHLRGEELPRVSLKYVIISYNYKILKLISQRGQARYDEHLLNIFSSLVNKNRAALWTLIAQKELGSPMATMLLLNENVYFVKALHYILDSCIAFNAQ